MTGSKNKDIVEEVFSRSIEVDDRVSALFACFKLPPRVSLEKAEKSPSDLKGSPKARDIESLDNKPFQSAKGAMHESLPERTIENKDSTRRVRTVVVASFAVLVLAFFVGGYLVQQGTASTKAIPQKHIDWSSLLDEISATIPKTVQLSVLESSDGSEMFLEGEALSIDAVYNFVDALSINRQVKSAELTETGIGEGQSQDMLTFSIGCCLVSDTKMAGSVDGDRDNSALDRSSLFTPMEAEEFFGGIQPVSEHAGYTVKSLLVSPKDAVFEDEETNGRITKKHAALTILGGYQDILKAIGKLQNRSQGVWFDSVSIKQVSGTGQLECSMGISVYVADGAGRKN